MAFCSKTPATAQFAGNVNDAGHFVILSAAKARPDAVNRGISPTVVPSEDTMTAVSAAKSYYVYIMASASRVLYTCVTNNIQRRVFEHRTQLSGFSRRYKL